MNSAVPHVAVVGRQNVGKSTLLNRLSGRKGEAIADAAPGVTRDRLEVGASWRGRDFLLIDTGGYVRRASGIEARVSAQAERAAEEADVILLVADAKTGPQEEDLDLARKLRKATVPVLVVANKVDTERDEAGTAAFNRFGLGEPVVVSALHGRGSGELLDRVVALLPPEGEVGEATAKEPRFALVGRPNVGKSSLFNRLVGEERSVVFEEAGTTRDAVDAVVDWDGRSVRFVDTAGVRRTSKTQGVEFYSVLRTQRAIERAHVALLVVDASEGLTTEDKRIASQVMEAGRALAISANKWDLVDEKDKLFKRLSEDLSMFAGAPILRTSATRKTGVAKLPGLLLGLNEHWLSRVSTSKVNEVLIEAQGERPAPRNTGRYRYATQVTSGPPTFILFGGEAPDGTYIRFLENRLRREFDLAGVPIRLKFRRRKSRT
jgi:GTP-binding protein